MVRAKHTIHVLHRRMLTRGCPTLSGVGKGWGFLLFMPRRLKRYHGRGDLHFITFSCYERRALLGTVCARNLFLKILEKVRRRCAAGMVGYVVMPEHVHLLLSEPKNGTLAKLLQVLKQRVSRAMRGRKRRRVSGQLSLAFPESLAGLRRFWQRRYYDFNVYSAQKIREKLDYIHTNPVQRRLVKHPQDWPWSSWSFYASGEQGVVRIEPTGEARRRGGGRSWLRVLHRSQISSVDFARSIGSRGGQSKGSGSEESSASSGQMSGRTCESGDGRTDETPIEGDFSKMRG